MNSTKFVKMLKGSGFEVVKYNGNGFYDSCYVAVEVDNISTLIGNIAEFVADNEEDRNDLVILIKQAKIVKHSLGYTVWFYPVLWPAIEAEKFIKILKDAFFDVIKYNGKGIYSSDFVAFKFPNSGELVSDVAKFVANSGEDRFEIAEAFNDVQTVQDGNDFIAFFPLIEWPKE